MRIDELTCRELVEVITDYLEGSLAPAERVRFEEHIVMCVPCTVYLEQMRETIRLTGMLREEEIPEPARERLLETFRDWKRST
jgi:predicted anti-sigma-YlaC factor YlaD